jgi:predicted restriction endonuclease
MERSGGVCEGEYLRINGSEVARTGNCNKEATVFAHIKHSGMGHIKSRDVITNILHECWLHHELMDERITPREYDRLRCGL